MLLVAQGPAAADTWSRPLPADGTVVLGRDPGAWAAAWEPFLARRHAELTARGDRLRVRRLPAAANPVFHAGRPADAFDLRPGGAFVVGRTTFTFADPATPTYGPPADPADGPVRTLAAAHGELDRLAFRDAPHRLDVLSKLPGVIAGAADDADLSARLCDMLLAGVRKADAVALVTPGRVLHADRRRAGPPFEPSRRLVAEAVGAKARTVLHVFGGKAAAGEQSFTLQAGYDWAFCTPVPGDACQGWAVYLTGRSGGADASTLLAPWAENDLRDDVKFAELVADVLGALRSVQVLRERQGVFRRFFSPGVMNLLSGRDAGLALEPREADVTVLFCDLRGFSREVERAGTDLLAVLNRVSAALGVMTENILRHRGAIADFLGDAALGFWGWPLDHPTKAEDACRAALGIRAAFETAAREPGHPLAGFRVGVGVASGRAVAGGIGTADQAKVTVFGPVVNLASRLQDMTKLLRVPILLDEPTAEAVRAHTPPDVARVRRLARVKPSGLSTPLTVAELVPPAGPGEVLTNEHVAAYEQGLEAFHAGEWDDALRLLRQLPAEDRGTDLLTQFILTNNRTPPTNWPGVIPLGSKG
jgi:adenylate cyclase